MFGTARTVAVRYKADVSGYVAGIQRMNAATLDFEKRAVQSAGKNKADWDNLGTAAMGAGLALGAGVAFAVKKAADFEQAMSQVGAVSGATSTQMKALGDAALQAGQDTVFSATEAAAAQAELAKAGVSTADILGGALRGSLDLAAAGGIDLAQSAEIAGQAMNIFGLKGKDVSHIADVLTAAANKSAAGVDDLGLALSQGGGVAASAGMTFEETAAALAAFADSGMKGSDAGTSLKTMMLRLTPSTKEAQEAVDALGLSAFDSQGEFIGLEAYAGKLQKGLAGLSAEQRTTTLQTIFGSDAIRAANVLYKQGASGIAEYIAAVDDQGAAQRMAARMTDNLKGDIESLSGAFETAFIETGSGGTESLRGLVQSIESVVNAYNGLDAGTQSAIFNMAALSAGILLVGGAGMKATTSIVAFNASLKTLGVTAGATGTALSLLGKAFLVGAIAYAASEADDWIATSKMATVATDDLADSMAGLAKGGNLSGGIAELFRDQGGWLQAKEDVVTTTEALDRFSTVANDAFGDDLHSKLARWSGNNAMSKFEKQVSQMDAALAQMVENGRADEAAASFEALMGSVDPAVVDEVKGKFTLYSEAVDTLAVSADGTRKALPGLDDAIDTNKDGMVDATEAAKEHQKAIEDLADTISKLGGGYRGEQAAIRDYKDAVTEAKDAVAGSRDEQDAALSDMAQSALDVAAAQIEMGRGSDQVYASMVRARSQFVETAVSMGRSRDYANELADAMGLIPDEVLMEVTASGVQQSTGEVMRLNESIRLLNGKTVTVQEEGANPSAGRVTRLDGAIFGLKGKTVKVEEIGTTAAGDRVVRFQGKVYALRGKSIDITANTGQASQAIAGVQGQLNMLNDKSITLTTTHRTLYETFGGAPQTTGPGVRLDGRADGGIDIYPYQAGGFFDKTIGQHRPGVYPVTKRGILMAEEGAGPWEAYISGHPLKRDRSRAMWIKTGQLLGMLDAFAGGGFYGDWQRQLANVRALARQYNRTIRFEDGSSRRDQAIQIFEDGTARWSGYYAAPANVSAAIAALNAAQDRYESAGNQPQQRSAPRPWQHSAGFYAKQRQWASQRSQPRGWEHSAEYYRKQREWASERSRPRGWQHSAEYNRKQAEWADERRKGGKGQHSAEYLRKHALWDNDARGWSGWKPKATSQTRYSSWSGGSGSSDAQQIASAVSSAIRSWQPVVKIGNKELVGVMRQATAERAGR